MMSDQPEDLVEVYQNSDGSWPPRPEGATRVIWGGNGKTYPDEENVSR
jgi:hypothetical protein